MIDFKKKLLGEYKKLHIDIETFSSINLKTAGVYRYAESVDFEIIVLAYAFDKRPVQVVDIAAGEALPDIFLKALKDPNITKCAHNAAFERTCLRAHGLDSLEVPAEQWECTMVKAAYCGLPLALEMAAKALGTAQKDTAGSALIRYFCMPCKPTITNGGRLRNFHYHDPEKWTGFKNYCVQDVEAERQIDEVLGAHELPDTERRTYVLDQKINDRGVKVDELFARNAIKVDAINSEKLKQALTDLTGVENVNSPAQLKQWLEAALNKKINSLDKAHTLALIAEVAAGTVKDALTLRQKLAKTSIKKYKAMLRSACADSRSRGLFQYYGANRTGRWAGRLVQLQNLPRNFLKDLEKVRKLIRAGDYATAAMLFDDLGDVLSQLIRTSFVAPNGKRLTVADFSAIEARVIAWLAGEAWRLEVFRTHGKIYEASASSMFGVKLEDVTKDQRSKGKVAELALGYQGSVGALLKMGAEAMGLALNELKPMVFLWRKANPKIVALWAELEKCALKAVAGKKKVTSKNRGIVFESNGKELTITLPSGRKLYYYKPSIKAGKFGKPALSYWGLNDKKMWTVVDTYGGKLTENIVQAIARDLLSEAMLKIDEKGLCITMHVHDEIVTEADNPEDDLKTMLEVMRKSPEWAKDLPLNAEGFVTDFYKKD